MTDYHCPLCDHRHKLESELGLRHLSHALSREDLQHSIDFAFSAGAYAFIANSTQQYVRDTQVFGVLGDKFSASGIFAGADQAQNWLRERIAVNAENVDQLLRRLQGDGAGEVDALRAINGSLRGLVHRAEFIKDSGGHIPSNTAGVDLQIVNRFTGEVVEYVQVKSNWSADPSTLQKTIRDFVSSPHYDETTTLAGPRELISQAKEMGIPNRLLEVSDAEGNRLSGERLRGLVEQGDASLEGAITLQGVAERIGQGALVGAAVTATVSAVGSFIEYRQGRISGREAFTKIGVEASRGAVIGGAMGGLSLLFPPGAIGLGIGVLVGTQVRRIVDIAYGKGAYKDLVRAMGAVEGALSATTAGVVVMEEAGALARKSQAATLAELDAFEQRTSHTDTMLASLRRFREPRS